MKKKVALYCFFVSLCILVGSLIYLRPFWGLQDDGNYIPSAEYFLKIGLWAGIKEVVLGDLKWGMVRPYMGALIVFLYGWTKETTFYTHILNIAWVIGVHWYFFWAILQSTMGKTFTGSSSSSRAEQIAILCLVSLSLPWMHWYFLIPAMQEKVVLLWAAGSIHWLSSKKAQESAPFAFLLPTLVITFLGAISKAQFLVFGPLLVAPIIQGKYKHSLIKAASILAGFFTAGLILKWIASQGIYTKSYGLSAVMENLRNTRALFPLLFLAAAHCFASAFWVRKKEKRDWSEIFTLSAPAISMTAFLIIMLPWRLGGYLYAAIIPFLALMAATWFYRLEKRLLKITATLLLCTAALTMTSWRVYKQWLPLRDLRVIIEEARAGNWPKDAKKVWNSCMEGHSHLNYYLKEFGKLSDVEVLLGTETNIAQYYAKESPENIYWLTQKEWCPVVENAEKMDLDSRSLILGGSMKSSFQLLHFRANKK
jgi:hypothetical protein